MCGKHYDEWYSTRPEPPEPEPKPERQRREAPSLADDPFAPLEDDIP